MVVQGNKIGTDATGTQHLGNGGDGVSISTPAFDVSADMLGGTQSGEGNLIAFNGGYGIDIPSGEGNTVLGNAFSTMAARGSSRISTARR
jgi:hypothetical protein